MVTIDIKTGETVQSGLTLEERVKQLEDRLDTLVRQSYTTWPRFDTPPMFDHLYRPWAMPVYC